MDMLRALSWVFWPRACSPGLICLFVFFFWLLLFWHFYFPFSKWNIFSFSIVRVLSFFYLKYFLINWSEFLLTILLELFPFSKSLHLVFYLDFFSYSILYYFFVMIFKNRYSLAVMNRKHSLLVSFLPVLIQEIFWFSHLDFIGA